MMKKIFANVISAVIMSASLAVPVNAVNVIKSEEIKISQIKSNIYNSVESYCISSTGDYIECYVTDVEVKKVSSSVNANTYVAKVKTSTGSYNKNGIRADSALTMQWVDGPGSDNSITSLEGYWSITSGSFNKGQIYWGSNYTGPTFAPYSKTVSQSFSVSNINYKSTDTVSGTLKAHSIAYIKSPTDNNVYQFSTVVSPTIFD